MGIIVSLLVDS